MIQTTQANAYWALLDQKEQRPKYDCGRQTFNDSYQKVKLSVDNDLALHHISVVYIPDCNTSMWGWLVWIYTDVKCYLIQYQSNSTKALNKVIWIQPYVSLEVLVFDWARGWAAGGSKVLMKGISWGGLCLLKWHVLDDDICSQLAD